MSTKNDGGPAFPPMDGAPGGPPGMSLRDWFAAAAVAGMASHDALRAVHLDGGDPARAVAKSAYDIADAMLTARSSAKEGEGA